MNVKRPQPVDADVGKLVRLRRLALKMSQTKLANQIGVTFQQVQKYENGSNRIGASRLQQIATALGVPVSYFFASNDAAVDSPKELLGLIETQLSLRLMKAFTRISDSGTQHSLVELAERLADKKT